MDRGRISIAFLLACVATAHAQTTTVITHGFTLGEKGVWVKGMADEIVTRAGAGRIYRYQYAANQHRWNVLANPAGVPDDEGTIVLLFNWTEEAGLFVEGPNWRFAQGAADALATALRDAEYLGAPGPADLTMDRDLHFIGHSRGAVVNAEGVRRLGVAQIAVDQMTALDPHPVNGTLDDCDPFNEQDWGDSVPVRWANVAFADDYWREDGNICDFDGMPLDLFSQAELDESALAMGGYSIDHSDTHLWYHATIDFVGEACDGEACMSAGLREAWFTPPDPNPLYDDEFGGYYFSIVGGGAGDRPDQPVGVDPGELPVIFNSGFEGGSVSGWRYHGGDVAASELGDDAGNDYLRLNGANASSTHNRFYLPPDASGVAFRFRVFTASADDQLVFDLIDDDGAVVTSTGLGLDMPTGSFADESLGLPGAPAAAYRLRARVDPGADMVVQAIAGIDDVDIVFTSCYADFNADGSLNILDFVAFQNAFVGVDPQADCDGSGMLNILDFVCFQNAFSGGCP
jgi:hypothetical protein